MPLLLSCTISENYEQIVDPFSVYPVETLRDKNSNFWGKTAKLFSTAAAILCVYICYSVSIIIIIIRAQG